MPRMQHIDLFVVLNSISLPAAFGAGDDGAFAPPKAWFTWRVGQLSFSNVTI